LISPSAFSLQHLGGSRRFHAIEMAGILIETNQNLSRLIE